MKWGFDCHKEGTLLSLRRVLVSAVKKEHINLKLCFFNNCFGDDFCKHRKKQL